jgi:PilZ domain
MPPQTPEKLSLQTNDRRCSPRFSCGGLAKIIRLPSDGLFLPGKLHDLSLGGCGVETVSPLECGALAEILLRVNASSFRALGQVRAMHPPAGIGMQFLQLTASGKDILVELIRELARQQVIANTLRAARQEPGPEQWDECRAALLKESLPLFERIVASQTGEGRSPVGESATVTLEGEEREIPLDIFI